MTLDEAKKAIQYLETNKVPYTIVGDNMQRYSTGIAGSMLFWTPGDTQDESTTCTCVRINVGNDQAAAIYELKEFCYDHIENIEVHTSDSNIIKGYLKAIGCAAGVVDQAIDKLSQYASKLSITGSTGDGIGDSWNGRIDPKYAGSDFNADGNLVGGTYRMQSDYDKHHPKEDDETPETPVTPDDSGIHVAPLPGFNEEE